MCGFLRENINFFSRLTILCHHQWDVMWWCVMELCLSILSINVYWIHPIFYTTWSHYHDILVRAYCVCILNEKYAILTYIKSLTTCYLFYTLTIRLAIFTDCVYNSPTDTGFVTSVGRVRKCHHFLLNDKTSLWKPLTIHYVRHNTTKMPPLGSVIDSLRLLFYIFICFVRNLIYLHSIIHRFFFRKGCLSQPHF